MKRVLLLCVLLSVITAALCQVKGCPLCKVSFIEEDGTLTPANVNVGNDDFDDDPEDNLPARCQQPKMTGPCRAAMRMYYYNTNSGRCEQFIYGGCGGNENRFDTEEECQEACQLGGIIDEPDYGSNKPNSCYEAPEAGPCLAYMPRYYYNAATGQCEKFVYGGCGGNKNNFGTMEQCLQTCQ